MNYNTILVIQQDIKNANYMITTNENFTNKNEQIPLIVQQVATYINQNLDKNIEITELVKLTNLDEREFRRIFMKYLLINSYQLILQKEIQK
jgi:transcriptional regulator GlxA family with amidase domain